MNLKKWLTLSLCLMVIGMMTSCYERIDAGKEGILVKLYGSDKGVQSASLVSGGTWYNPVTESVYEFPTTVQTIDYEPFSVNAKDGSVFHVDPTLSFHVKEGSTPQIFKKYRKDIEEITKTTLFNYIKDAFRIEFNRYTTDSIISSREIFENAVQINITEVLKKEGFVYDNLTSGIQYPKEIVNAITEKNTAVQRAAEANNNLKVEEARAKIKIIQAKAEAEANKLKHVSLTPLLIQMEFIQKWDGKTPLYGVNPTLFKNVQ